jgi:deoxycytidylate deaminase
MSGCILNDDRVVSLFERGFPKGVPDLYRRERYLDATSRESGCATNGVSTLRGDEESACAHKLDNPQLPRKAPVELTAE